MKTGGTLNFLKRAGAILMLVAVFASSCNKYADDFKQLNTKLDGLASSIGGMSTLVTDVAGVKASVASALTAIAAIPNPTASITKLQSDLTAAAASIATINTNLNSLTTVVNGLPKLADVNAIATKVAADLTTQLAKLNTDLTAAIKANNTTLQSAFSAAIAANNATLEALVKGDIVANNAAISAAITANNAAISAAIAANNKAISDAIVANNAAITAADAAAMVANNAAIVSAIVANNPAIAALIAANNAAVNTAIIGNNSAMATLIQAQIDALKTAMAGTSTDAVTAATINGLTAQLAAMKVTLGIIYQNTILKVGVPTISVTGGYGTPSVGCTLNAATASTLETATYQWRITTAVAGTTYADIAGATASTYMPVAGDIGKTIVVVVTGTGNYLGSTATSVATLAVVDNIALVSVVAPVLNSTSGTDVLWQVGSKLRLGTLAPTTVSGGATVTYQWQTSPTATGVYTTVGTSSTYTPAAVDASSWLRVVVTGTGGWNGVVTSPSNQIKIAPVTAVAYTSGISNNMVTITLTSGTFKGATTTYPNSDLVASDFTWTGVDAAKFSSALTVTTKVSPTVVTIQLGGAVLITDNSINAVAIPAVTLVTPSTSAPTISSSPAIMVNNPLAAVTSGVFSMNGMNTLVIKLSAGTFKSTIAASDFTFAGPDAALIASGTFTRTSSTTVTVTGIISGLGATNTVTIPAATMTAGTQAVISSVVGWTTITSNAVALTGKNTINVSIGSGTLKLPATAALSQSDLVFTGTDAVALASATITYTSPTTFQITGFSGLVGTDNVVTLKASGMATQAGTLTAATDNIVALTSASFSVTTTAAGNVVITLATGTFNPTLTAANFTFSGASVAALSAGTPGVSGGGTICTIAVAAGSVVGTNVVVVKTSALATAATIASVTAW